MFGCQLRLSTLIERGPQPKFLKMDLLSHSIEPDNRYFGMRYTKGTLSSIKYNSLTENASSAPLSISSHCCISSYNAESYQPQD